MIPDLDAPELIIVTINPRDSLAVQAGLLAEGTWRNSDRAGWMYRVDAPRPELRQQQHVHVCLKKHQNAKTQQASWNVDGSRHDKATFNTQVAAQSAAQHVARTALGLAPDVVLEEITGKSKAEEGTKLLVESRDVTTDEVLGAVYFRARR